MSGGETDGPLEVVAAAPATNRDLDDVRGATMMGRVMGDTPVVVDGDRATGGGGGVPSVSGGSGLREDSARVPTAVIRVDDAVICCGEVDASFANIDVAGFDVVVVVVVATFGTA